MALKTTAQNKQDVDEMSKADRLWDSLSYSYGKQQEASNKSYDKAISQQDRAMVGRGMQRSSYGMNTLAGLRNQKINAANDIDSQKIADYENRLYQLEKDEDEKAYRDKTFEEQVRQFNENLGFQKSEAERAQGNVDREYEANRSDVAWNQAFQQGQLDYQKEQDALAQENLLRQEAYQKERDALAQENLLRQEQYQQEQNAIQNDLAERTFQAGRADTEWSQQYQQAAFEYQKQQDAFNNALAQSQFDFSKASEDQKYVYNYIVTAAANGGDVSDELLERAGISRADYNAMKAAAKTGGGGGGPRKTTTPTEDQTDAQRMTDAIFEAMFGGTSNVAGNMFSTTFSSGASNVTGAASAAMQKMSNAANKGTTAMNVMGINEEEVKKKGK